MHVRVCMHAHACVCARMCLGYERERDRKLMYIANVHVSDQLKRSVVLNRCHCQCTNDQCLILDHQW